jgi:hypothetical protein
MDPLYDYLFHFNHYQGLWHAIPRAKYLDYWTNDDGSHDSEKFCLLEPKATEIHNITDDNSVFVSELSSITTL